MKEDYYPGKDCTCMAHGECECGCGADWTPREVYRLREHVKEIESELEKYKYICEHYELITNESVIKNLIIKTENDYADRFERGAERETTRVDAVAKAIISIVRCSKN